MAFYKERKLWNEIIETLPREKMRALQLERLKKQVAYNYQNSPFYRDKMDDAGAKPDRIDFLTHGSTPSLRECATSAS